ncbi:ArsC family reductase [uncultured Sphingomonas sp.]|uniref:ArsC family reductase n=1 Tax=uncultured Sphingomonas sp. TaxID=158754 RepID=UPI0025F949AC|nr:ArsC family reductase [uncultured Sphingomonas sp.]
MTPTLYGIPNCDTVKKARTWFDTHGIAYTFHDYKKLGADRAKLAAWAAEVGWEKLLNRAGTTFRKLSDADRADIDQAKAIELMVAQPSLIKRPVVEGAGALLVGFKPEVYAAAFA